MKNKKEAIRALFEELYESKNEIWGDVIHEALLYLADDAECTDIIEELTEEYDACDIVVIHKSKAYEMVNEEIEKSLVRMKYKIESHYASMNSD